MGLERAPAVALAARLSSLEDDPRAQVVAGDPTRIELDLEQLPMGAARFDVNGFLLAMNTRLASLLPTLQVAREPLPACLVGALERCLEPAEADDPDRGWRARLLSWLDAVEARELILDLPGHKQWLLRRVLTVGSDTVLLLDDRSELRQLQEALRLSARELEVRTREHRLAIEQARASAERAQRSKMRFFAAASHDLLQPLNAARIFASALADQHAANPEIRELSNRIDASLEVAEEVIDVLVDIAKLQSHGFKATIEEFSIREVLDSLLLQYRSIADRRGLSLRLVPGNWMVRTDRRLLRRLLQNLLANALRYTARGGVLIGARRRGKRLSVEVWDTGIGIPEDRIEELFEEFQRGPADSPWGEKGLGLGLSICRGIATLLGHPLRVSSRLGKGSRFAVEVDLADVQEPRLQAAARSAAPQNGHIAGELKVLCVDNERPILDALAVLLRGWGVRCTGVASAEEALAQCAQDTPDVVLADYHLDSADGLDGLDLYRLLQERIPDARRPSFVLLTANRFDDLKHRCDALGVPILHKPVKANRLRALLESQPKALALR